MWKQASKNGSDHMFEKKKKILKNTFEMLERDY